MSGLGKKKKEKSQFMCKANNKRTVSKVLQIGAFNCQGMREKVDYPDFLKLVAETDIFGVCETWLNEENDGDIQLPDYTFYPLNRKKEKNSRR